MLSRIHVVIGFLTITIHLATYTSDSLSHNDNSLSIIHPMRSKPDVTVADLPVIIKVLSPRSCVKLKKTLRDNSNSQSKKYPYLLPNPEKFSMSEKTNTQKIA